MQAELYRTQALRYNQPSGVTWRHGSVYFACAVGTRV